MNQLLTDQFIAENAGQKKGLQEISQDNPVIRQDKFLKNNPRKRVVFFACLPAGKYKKILNYFFYVVY
ncbi:MAG: hypothetical protein A2581_03995 [Candidatus Staskawiczbacteria bacterium RIFOXYD1_FULL_37_110]|nr:MAG: hypothetical protein A2581_03995 [Candidatus Staskawiczbacteria bacterium RIFOXYD1_FULL_37_110]